MEHPEHDRLAALALEPGSDGAPDDAGVVAHLQSCAACREEVDELRDLAGLVRGVRHERLEPPPPQVWQGVVDELGLRGRRTRPLLWAAAAAVVGLGLGSLATWAVVRSDGPEPAEVLRTVALEPVTDGTATSGTARLLEHADGAQSVEVSAADLGTSAGHFEVWLIRPGTDRMISIGVLAPGDPGEFAVPATALADGFTLVDVSDEPDDGEPTHSGDSVLRGDLAG